MGNDSEHRHGPKLNRTAVGPDPAISASALCGEITGSGPVMTLRAP
jgi:hypothetical protein